MHYKNGTEAREGDSVVGRNYLGRVITGTIHSMNAGATACNGQVATIVPGGTIHQCLTIGELYSAEDALAAIERTADEKPATGTASA